MNRLPARLYADLIGEPFLEGGRGPVAWDCLGLVIELQRRQGRDVPDYASTPDELARQYHADRGVLGNAAQLPHAECGCVVLLRSLEPGKVHMGVMVDDFMMLHASEPAKSVVLERLRGSRWERRVLGYYLPLGCHSEDGEVSL